MANEKKKTQKERETHTLKKRRNQKKRRKTHLHALIATMTFEMLSQMQVGAFTL